ncbi:hypothetical protein OPV22_024080 [Ensete ventricosum]|uniref:Secreted protein n=2 Tax=Ensete ventricosum TaxID=4639 RepID=A0AAV8QTJ5_ENSVE|nr:hypothetical protein OPV22_024080 [Ensete ventricosum]
MAASAVGSPLMASVARTSDLGTGAAPAAATTSPSAPFATRAAVGCFDGDDVSNSKGGRAEWKSGDWLCTRSFVLLHQM